MSGSRYFENIAWVITAVMLILVLLFLNGGALGLQVLTHTMGYEDKIFDNTKVHTIDIEMEDWEEMLDNAMTEEYYPATVVIDGESFQNIAIRCKGNTSLSQVSSMDSDRYSLKLEFDHYDSAVTYHGLDKLCLNNLIQDATMMKDYLTYTMMAAFDANAPLCSFSYITVNGQDWGLYLAVEAVEESFLERNYGTAYGNLYKPDSMSMGGGNRGNGEQQPEVKLSQAPAVPDQTAASDNTAAGRPDTKPDQAPAVPDQATASDNTAAGRPGTNSDNTATADNPPAFSDRKQGGPGGMSAADVKLQYIDQEPDSYANIFDNAKTDITKTDKTRLIASLKALTDQQQLDTVVDVEQVIRYFVVHNYVCNGDSYTGSMVHNYYLYEEDGQLSMLPWDYNLAFGTFQGGQAQSTVNTPIDAPVSGGDSQDRPMWSWILSEDSYTQLYHQYMAEFVTTVDIEAMIDKAYTLIQPYVAKDPTAFYTSDEFEAGVAALKQFCSLRSQSIATQLNTGNTATLADYADATGLTLSDMGSMHGGRPGGDTPKDFSQAQMPFPGNRQTDAQTEDSQTVSPEASTADATTSDSPQSAQQRPDRNSTDNQQPDPSADAIQANPQQSDLTADDTQANPQQSDLTADDTQATPQQSDLTADDMQANSQQSDLTADNTQANPQPPNFPSGAVTEPSGADSNNLLLLGLSALVLAAGLIIARLYY